MMGTFAPPALPEFALVAGEVGRGCGNCPSGLLFGNRFCIIMTIEYFPRLMKAQALPHSPGGVFCRLVSFAVRRWCYGVGKKTVGGDGVCGKADVLLLGICVGFLCWSHLDRSSFYPWK